MAIIIDDLSSVPATLQSGWYMNMQLTSTSGSTLELAVGCTEEVAGALYLVDSGNETVDVTGVVDGDAWVYVGPDTATTGLVYLSNTAPVYNPSKRGYYNPGATNDKAIFKVTKSGTDYSNRKRIWQNSPYGLDIEGDLSVQGTAELDGNVVITGELAGNVVITGDVDIAGEFSIDMTSAGIIYRNLSIGSIPFGNALSGSTSSPGSFATVDSITTQFSGAVRFSGNMEGVNMSFAGSNTLTLRILKNGVSQGSTSLGIPAVSSESQGWTIDVSGIQVGDLIELQLSGPGLNSASADATVRSDKVLYATNYV